jgi:hypothetical protein
MYFEHLFNFLFDFRTPRIKVSSKKGICMSETHAPERSNFPRHEIVEALKKEVLADADDPFKPNPGTLYDVLPEFDSLTAVRCLLTIEKFVSFNVPTKVVQRGGYTSANEMIEHLVSQTQKLFEHDRKRSQRKAA